ncbi:MAG: hypothetical protein V4710_12445, partial [Verrucomicrobiota bacterium]
MLLLFAGLIGEESLRQTLELLQNAVSYFTVLLAMALYAGMLFTPRFSKRILLPPVLFSLWTAMGAFPASLYLEKNTELVLGAIQIVLALTLLWRFGDRSGWLWATREKARQRPLFTWKNLFLSLGMTGLLALLMAGLFLHAGAFMIGRKTAGFVQIRPSGAFMEERRFQRTDKEIRLVAMVHIAQRDFYEEIANTLPENASAVVLLEGVTDEKNLLKKKFGYANIANALGLTSQADSSFQKKAMVPAPPPPPEPPAGEPAEQPVETKIAEGPPQIEYLSGDVDVSVFQPATLRFLEALGMLLGSKSLREALLMLQDPDSPLTDDSEAELVFTDILDKRNEHLITEI